MGIIRLSVITAGVLGAAMVHFGNDQDLPADRIGREPTILQDTIQPVSANLNTAISEGDILSTSNAQPLIVHPNSAPTVTLVSHTSAQTPQNQADEAEAAARMMANGALPQVGTVAEAPNTTDSATQKTAQVSASAVNMRAGPSTSHGVVAKLTRGTKVIDLGAAADGWSQIQVVSSGELGFMASRFLDAQL
jgi:uncharacterized protein YgiM (DUF1202 family)